MQAVILAAGRGNRLRPQTDTVPKSLLLVAGRPIIAHTLAALPDAITEIIVVVGYRGDQIKEYCQQQPGRFSFRFVEQPQLAGSALALWAAQSSIGNGPFLVVHGDDLYRRPDLESLIQYPRAFGVKTLPNLPRGSVDIVSDDHDNLTRFTDPNSDGRTGRLCTGSYVLQTDIFATEPVQLRSDEFGLPHTVLAYARTHPVRVVELEFWRQINTPEDLLRAQPASP